MPYHVTSKDGGFKVTSKNHPEGFSKRPMSKKRARAQQAAIYANADPTKESFSRKLDSVLENLIENNST